VTVILWLALLGVIFVPFAIGFAMLLALRLMQVLVRASAEGRLPGFRTRAPAR
jgi:hypothetical protein